MNKFPKYYKLGKVVLKISKYCFFLPTFLLKYSFQSPNMKRFTEGETESTSKVTMRSLTAERSPS